MGWVDPWVGLGWVGSQRGTGTDRVRLSRRHPFVPSAPAVGLSGAGAPVFQSQLT